MFGINVRSLWIITLGCQLTLLPRLLSLQRVKDSFLNIRISRILWCMASRWHPQLLHHVKISPPSLWAPPTVDHPWRPRGPAVGVGFLKYHRLVGQWLSTKNVGWLILSAKKTNADATWPDIFLNRLFCWDDFLLPLFEPLGPAWLAVYSFRVKAKKNPPGNRPFLTKTHES